MGLLIFLAYAFFFASLYPQVLFYGQTFYRPDIYTFYYPIWKFASESIRSGIFPLWNPYSAFGVPFFANVQTCVLYPGAVLFYALPFPLAFNVYILTHLVLVCFGTYHLARKLGLTDLGAFLAGLLFGVGGYACSSMHLVITLASISYFPWVLLLMLRLFENPEKKTSLCLSLVLLFQYLSGDPAVLFLTMLILVTATVYRLITEAFRKRAFNVALLKRMLASLFIFAGLSAFQSVPFFEFVLSSTRKGQTLADASTWSAQWETAVTFLIPHFHELASLVQGDESLKVITHGIQKQIWLTDPYIGVVTLFFAAAAAAQRTPRVLALGLMAFLCLGLSFGDGSLLYLGMRYLIPGLEWIRFPVRFLFPLYLSAALLAAMGAEALSKNPAPKKTAGFWLWLGLSIAAAAAVLSFRSPIEWFCGRLADVLYAGNSPSKFFSAEAAGRIVSQVAVSLQRSLLLLCVSSLLVLLRGRGSAFLILFGLTAFFDLALINGKEPTVPIEVLMARGPVIDRLKGDPSLFRSMPSPRMVKKMYELRSEGSGEVREQADKLSPNIPLLHRLHLVWVYDSIFLRNAVAGQKFLVQKTIQEAQDWLSVLNVKYMLSTEKSLSENFDEVATNSVGHLFLNRTVLPRAYWVPEQAVDAKHALIPSAALARHQPANIILYQLNRVEMSVFCPDKGWLFFSDIHYPGWKAFVDSEPAEIFTLNSAFRGLRMEAGTHRIEWKFRPDSVMLGGLVTLMTIAAVIFFRKI